MTLNLIRLIFDPSRSKAIQIIGNPYRLHQFVYETMSASGNPGRILYRLEANYGFHNPEPCVLVQVEHSVVPQINDRCWGKPDFVRMESKSSAGVLREAGVYRFRSRVNPVRSEPPRSTAESICHDLPRCSQYLPHQNGHNESYLANENSPIPRPRWCQVTRFHQWLFVFHHSTRGVGGNAL